VFTAVVASEYPELLNLLAYQTLIVREARRCGGWGWLTYDTVFRQQMAGEWRGEDWGRLNPYLFSSTFLMLGNNWSNCPLCLESDHREDCALVKGKGVRSVCHPARDPGIRAATQVKGPSGNGLFRMESRRVILSVLLVQAHVCAVGATTESLRAGLGAHRRRGQPGTKGAK
jgi:hypothetical protein